MNANQIIERIRGLRPQLDALGVASLGLFGSVARGEERDDSDIDILVAFDGPATFDQYMDAELLLANALGRRVDLVTERGCARYSGQPSNANCAVSHDVRLYLEDMRDAVDIPPPLGRS